ncbi:MAG: hypothetical protein JWR26_293 [Pedosphaera sp.]|nr:hypothetical protein [Pedosphaera sp.]
MNDKNQPEELPANASREEILAALFANMVIQQTNFGMMMLGKVAHPQTGEFMQDLESARMFIDQLEMLEAKTKGNLSKEEEGLIKQALAALHMAFVEAVQSASNEPKPDAQREIRPSAGTEPKPAPSAAPEPAAKQATAPPPAEPPAPEEESRKKFSKKY